MTDKLYKIVISLCMVVMLGSPFAAYALDTRADYALLVDAETGVVLFEKNADAAMSPASMSKLMTVLMVFDALKDGSLALGDKLRVSDDAWRRGGAASGGSTMFLEARSQVSVADLLRGVIIQSGNDACIVLAEALGGSEEVFADMMTARAQELGMTKSRFTNATGLPHPEHRMSARDLATLTSYMIAEHGDFYRLFAERDFTWNKIRQTNRNPLLYANMGADGLKTGHTEVSGYGLVASAQQSGRRLILVVNGLTSKRARAAEARKMMNWGFRSFSREAMIEANMIVAELPVWHGQKSTVPVRANGLFEVVLPRSGRRKMAITLTYEKPILAPVRAGDRLARLKVTVPGLMPQETTLVAAEDVGRGNFLSRAFGSLGYLLSGKH